MDNELSQLKTALLSEFKCQKSGNCCKREGYVYVTQTELTAMAKTLKLSAATFTKRYITYDNGWPVIATPTHRPRCFLNDKNQCQVYDNRPIACKTYPDWPSIWESKESILSEIAQCPGLKRAFEKIKLNHPPHTSPSQG